MKHQRLYEALFNMKGMPPELKNETEANRLIAHLDKVIITVHHIHSRLLLTANETAGQLYFIERGIARGYFYNERNRREYTVWIWDEGAIFTDPVSFFKRTPSMLNIEVMPGGQLSSISLQQLMQVFSDFPYSANLQACISLQHADHFTRRNYDLTYLSAWERYIKMCNTYPGIETKIPKEIIASYLGIAPQSLSRLLRKNSHPDQ